MNIVFHSSDCSEYSLSVVSPSMSVSASRSSSPGSCGSHFFPEITLCCSCRHKPSTLRIIPGEPMLFYLSCGCLCWDGMSFHLCRCFWPLRRWHCSRLTLDWTWPVQNAVYQAASRFHFLHVGARCLLLYLQLSPSRFFFPVCVTVCVCVLCTLASSLTAHKMIPYFASPPR